MSIGGTELLIILIFCFLLFGPDKLPQLGRTIGRALRQFRETQQRMTSMVQTEVIDPMAAAVNESASSPEASAARSEDADADEDASASEGAEPAKKETFAERRARLAAEQAEREAENADASPIGSGAADEATSETASEASADEDGDAPAGTTSDEPAETAETSGEAAPESEKASEEPPATTTADLYARRPRKHRVTTEAEDEAGEAASQEDTATPGAPAEGGEQ